MPDQDGFITAEDTLPVFELVNDGLAFQNRVEPFIEDAGTELADQLTKIGVLAGIVDPNGIDNWTQADFASLLVKLVTLDDTLLEDLLPHTDRVSGATISFLEPEPNVFSLLTTTTALQFVDDQIAAGGGTETPPVPTDQFFGTLTAMPPVLQTITDFTKDLDLKIQKLAPFDDPEFVQPLPTTANAFYEATNVLIQISITQENTNFDNAVSKIADYGFAEFLIQPSVEWRDFMVENMATPELAALIPEIE